MNGVTRCVISNQAEYPIPLSKEDVFLFGNNALSLACSALKSRGIAHGWLGGVSDITYIAATLGESLVSARTFNEFEAALPGLALAGARLFIFRSMADHALLKPVALAINAYGTYALFRRAVTELSKCKKLSDMSSGKYQWEILRNSLVHSVNVSCSAYKTNFLFNSFFASQTGNAESGSKEALIVTTKESNDNIISRIMGYEKPEKPGTDWACAVLSPVCHKLKESSSDPTVIPKAYRSLSLRVHPDHNLKNKKNATSAFKDLAEAKDILVLEAKKWKL